jgi:hypothetical protein
MDKACVRPASLRLVLILSVCLGSLLIHFFTESFDRITGQYFAMEWIEHGEKDGPTHEAGEDTFVLPEFFRPVEQQGGIRIVYPDSPVIPSFSSIPLLPPPIAG